MNSLDIQALQIGKDFKTDLIIRDEDQYGSGIESGFDFAFENLEKNFHQIGLLSVSATYDILDVNSDMMLN